MNIIIAYIRGLQKVFSNKIMWALLYGFNFLFAFIVSLPIFDFFDSKLSFSKATDKLADGFNFTIANDIMTEYGDAIGMLFSSSLMVTLLYLLLSVFLVGGILYVFKINPTEGSLQTFWGGCAKYFWRMFRLTAYFLIIHFSVFFFFFSIFNMLTEGGVQHFDSEKEIWDIGYIVFGIYLFVATVFFMIHDYAKIHIVHEDKKWIFRPILQAFKLVFQNFGKTFLLYILNLATFGILFFIYWKTNPSNIMLAFLVGQIFIIGRIGTKLLNLGSAGVLYEEISK